MIKNVAKFSELKIDSEGVKENKTENPVYQHLNRKLLARMRVATKLWLFSPVGKAGKF